MNDQFAEIIAHTVEDWQLYHVEDGYSLSYSVIEYYDDELSEDHVYVLIIRAHCALLPLNPYRYYTLGQFKTEEEAINSLKLPNE